MNYRLIAVMGLLLISAVAVSAQTSYYPNVVDVSEVTSPYNTNARQDEMRFGSRSMVMNDFERCYQSLKRVMSEEDKKLLSPTQQDKDAYKHFLKQKNTGLIRLLPLEKYVGKLSIIGGGAYYSFVRLTHEYGQGSDISLEQGYFSVGFAGANYGFMLNLGDVSLDDITIEKDEVNYLASFIPPSSEPEARIQQQHARGFEAHGFKYKDRLLAKVNSTYILRSINYDRSDCLVAFRVMRQEAVDDSVIILWKMLKKYPTPRLEQ